MNDIEQLSNYFKPEHYTLDLDIDKANRLFNGKVKILGRPLKDQIKLHAKDLDIKTVSLDGTQIKWQQLNDIITIDGSGEIIDVEFSGKLSDTALNGLYISKYYNDKDDQIYELFTTQFESHYARKCFPCIDEPAAKAKFSVSIKSADPTDLIISNMPGKKQNGRWYFNETPPMSTYLLAFAGGQFIEKSKQTISGIKVRVLATPVHKIEDLDYSLETAVRSLEFFEDYFQTPYPLPKLDNLALPDFSAGAMENWGLITYRESAMLTKNSDPIDNKMYVATVIAHEISHQWFGNLITMKWWNDLWLNESFASLMENVAVDHIYPEYKVWESVQASDAIYAKNRDASLDVQAIRQNVQTADEIATLFDGAIVYAKGQRLLGMLKTLIGEEAFRHGLIKYFKKYQYSNTTADDLWQTWSNNSTINVADFMNKWLEQPGYPLIDVQATDNQITLTQTRMLSRDINETSVFWPVPILTKTDKTTIFSTPNTTLDTDNAILNYMGTGHFVVKYDQHCLNKILSDFTSLPRLTQLNILTDQIILANTRHDSVANLLSIVSKLDINLDVNLIDLVNTSLAMSKKLTTLHDKGSKSKIKPLEKSFIARLYRPAYHQLFDDGQNPSIDDKRCMSSILSAMLYAEDCAATEFADNVYLKYENQLENMSSNYRDSILRYKARSTNNLKLYNKFLTIYATTNDVDLKMNIIEALTAFRDTDIINRLLAKILAGEIRNQDVIYFISGLMSNSEARTTTWQWLRHNWPWVEQQFSDDMSHADFVRVMGSCLITNSEYTEFVAFINQISSPSLERVIAIAKESIANRLKWVADNQQSVINFLRDKVE